MAKMEMDCNLKILVQFFVIKGLVTKETVVHAVLVGGVQTNFLFQQQGL